MLVIVRTWILLSALLVGGGWVLSALHELNRVGYGVIFLLAAAAAICRRQNPAGSFREKAPRALRKFCRRFRRAAPLCFLALALLSLLAGACYLPSNPDSNQYRISRVLHWLWQEQWHWIRTLDLRMNIAGCGFEWLSTPLVLFTRADRWLFLINWVSYLMLPGLIFSVFTRLRVRPRVAWWWAWFLSSGWCFIMQAGSTVNDFFAVIYALAAVDFALRARQSGRVSDLWFSMLAAALLTGAKQTAIPLALLWLMAAGASIRLLFKRPLATAAVIGISLLVSAAPLMLFNLQHSGTWIGVPRNSPFYNNDQLHVSLPVTIGNICYIALQNLKPPIFPFANAWNAEVQRFLHTPLGAHFIAYDQFGRLSWGVAESSAGIGLGICLLILISVMAARRGRPAPTIERTAGLLWWLRWTPLALFVLFAAKVGTFQNARQMASYYVFFFPLLLAAPGHGNLVRRAWWQRLGVAVMLIAVGLLVVSRDRPLFPSQTIIGWLQAKNPQSKLISVLQLTYSDAPTFARQWNILNQHLPPNEPVIGYAATIGGAEPSMGLPFGRRRVDRVLPDDTPEQLRSRGIHYVLVEDQALNFAHETIGQWVTRYDGVVVQQFAFTENPYEPPHPFYLVRLQETATGAVRSPVKSSPPTGGRLGPAEAPVPFRALRRGNFLCQFQFEIAL